MKHVYRLIRSRGRLAVHSLMARLGLRTSMEEPDALHEFWRQPAPEGNVPADYVIHVERSRALLQLVSDLPKDATILEVGCNVGRNLAYLHDHGYENVVGVEINPHAVDLLRVTYPQLADREIYVGSAEDMLPGFANGAFDLVFTMAVLEHIHPGSAAVFDHIARIGREVLAVEPREGYVTHRQHPHNIGRIFRSRGMQLVSRTNMWDFPYLRDDALRHYAAWRFKESKNG